MKVYEILERKQINEVAPAAVIAGIGIGTIVSAISVGMAAWGAYDIYNFIKQYGDDPESVTEEQWGELFIDAALLFTPGLARLGRRAVARLFPDAAKKWGGNWIREHVIKKHREARRKAKEKYDREMRNARTPEGRAAAKKRYEERKAKAKKAAETGLSNLPRYALEAVSLMFTANYLREWYEKYKLLEIEYQACLDGDKTTKFGDAGPEEAYELLQRERIALLGEASAVIAVQFGLLNKVGAFFKIVGGVLGKGAGYAVGGRQLAAITELVGKLPGGTVQAAAKLFDGSPARKIAFTTFVQMPEAQKLASYLTGGFLDLPVRTLRDWLGMTTDTAIGILNAGLEAAGEKLGVTAPQILPGPKPPAADPDDPASATSPDDKYGVAMKVQRNPQNPKIIYVDGVQITDAEGYQDVMNSTLDDIKNRANLLGRPDPTAGIPKRPGRDYTRYNPK